jgi:sec-independent protein translocase protein TatA
MPFDLSAGELLVILLVALLLFGGKLPEVARKFGQSLAEFRRGMSEEARKLEHEVREAERRALAAREARPQTPSSPTEPADASRPPAVPPP